MSNPAHRRSLLCAITPLGAEVAARMDRNDARILAAVGRDLSEASVAATVRTLRVEVVGRTRPIDEPTLGPFTGRALVARRVSGVRIEREGRHQVSGAIDHVERAPIFLVEDETGVVRVDRSVEASHLR